MLLFLFSFLLRDSSCSYAGPPSPQFAVEALDVSAVEAADELAVGAQEVLERLEGEV